MKFSLLPRGRHRRPTGPQTRRERKDAAYAHRLAGMMPANSWDRGYVIVDKQLWHTVGPDVIRPFTPAETMKHFNAITGKDNPS